MDDQTKSNKFNLSVDLRIIIIVLLLVIGGMLAAWRPWQARTTQDDNRTVSVTGEAKLQADPDEFAFYPSYQFKNKDKDAGLAELTKKSDEVIKKLKELGVADSKIKQSSNGYNYSNYYFDQSTGQNNYTLSLTITLDNKDQAQKIQDYLVSTAPMGMISPQASFSDKKRKELEAQARDEATKDARSKADQSAKNLGFKIGAVKSVNDGAGFNGGPVPLSAQASAAIAEDTAKSSLAVQPGQNDLSYSVTVVYYLK